MGQWEECPHFVNAEGFDPASPMIYGSYSPLPTIGDSQPYFYLHYPFSSPYYQLPGSPSIGYLNSSTGMLQLDPMHLYYVPDELLYPPAPGFYHPFGSLKAVRLVNIFVSPYGLYEIGFLSSILYTLLYSEVAEIASKLVRILICRP